MCIRDRHYKVNFVIRDNHIKIVGQENEVREVKSIIENLLESIQNNKPITAQSVEYIISLAKQGEEDKFSILSDIICLTAKGKQIRCKTLGQLRYCLLYTSRCV